MNFLYRGVNEMLDRENGGRLKPRGSRIEVIFSYDGHARHDGRVVYGLSEMNTVEAHHIESGLYDGCFISTSRSRAAAERFARHGNGPGWLYVIDEAQLTQHNVIARERPDPLHPGEQEVSLRAHDGGELPLGIVIKKVWIEA